MEGYSVDVQTKMKRLFGWLSEKDRHRYAAVEATKLGHGSWSSPTIQPSLWNERRRAAACV